MPRDMYEARRRYEYDDEEKGGRSHYERPGEKGGNTHRSASSSKRSPLRSTSSFSAREARRRRSRSPDFERDRARERETYDRHNHKSLERGTDEGAEQRDGSKSAEPDFGTSGLLAKESNQKDGVALKYHEPPEARKPKKKYRLYVYKDGKEIELLHISRQSCYLIGRDRTVCDIPVDHPSCSKQHAVIQYRNIVERNEFGDEKSSTKAFLIDLDSANGCEINDQEVPPSRYYELRSGDTLRLGGSTREYVFLAEE